MRAILFPNVPRQVSLAGGAGGSQETGAKALGLLFCQQALCLSGGTSNWCSSKLLTGQRLTGRVGSAILFIYLEESVEHYLPLLSMFFSLWLLFLCVQVLRLDTQA